MVSSNEMTEASTPVQSENQLKCPKCGSTHIHIDKRGFDAKKACCGSILCGPFGLLFGAENANELRKTCLDCKNSW